MSLWFSPLIFFLCRNVIRWHFFFPGRSRPYQPHLRSHTESLWPHHMYVLRVWDSYSQWYPLLKSFLVTTDSILHWRRQWQTTSVPWLVMGNVLLTVFLVIILWTVDSFVTCPSLGLLPWRHGPLAASRRPDKWRRPQSHQICQLGNLDRKSREWPWSSQLKMARTWEAGKEKVALLTEVYIPTHSVGKCLSLVVFFKARISQIRIEKSTLTV